MAKSKRDNKQKKKTTIVLERNTIGLTSLAKIKVELQEEISKTSHKRKKKWLFSLFGQDPQHRTEVFIKRLGVEGVLDIYFLLKARCVIIGQKGTFKGMSKVEREAYETNAKEGMALIERYFKEVGLSEIYLATVDYCMPYFDAEVLQNLSMDVGDFINLMTLGYKGGTFFYTLEDDGHAPLLTQESLVDVLKSDTKEYLETFNRDIVEILEENRELTVLDAYKHYSQTVANAHLQNGEKINEDFHTLYAYTSLGEYLAYKSDIIFEVPLQYYMSILKNPDFSTRNMDLLDQFDAKVINFNSIITFASEVSASSTVLKVSRIDDILVVRAELMLREKGKLIFDFQFDLIKKDFIQVCRNSKKMSQKEIINKILIKPWSVVYTIIGVYNLIARRFSDKPQIPVENKVFRGQEDYERVKVIKYKSTTEDNRDEKPLVRIPIYELDERNFPVIRGRGTKHTHHRSPITHWRSGHYRKTSDGQTYVRGHWVNAMNGTEILCVNPQGSKKSKRGI